jgi:hypothetical protein
MPLLAVISLYGAEVILRLWQPVILKVLAKGIDSPLRGFVTAC